MKNNEKAMQEEEQTAEKAKCRAKPSLTSSLNKLRGGRAASGSRCLYVLHKMRNVESCSEYPEILRSECYVSWRAHG